MDGTHFPKQAKLRFASSACADMGHLITPVGKEAEMKIGATNEAAYIQEVSHQQFLM